MGCYTWFYKKVKNQPTDEDKIRFFKNRQTKWLQRLETAVKDGGMYPNEEDKWFPFNNENEVLKRIEEIKWMLENVVNFKDFEENFKNDKYRGSKEATLYYMVVYQWKAPIDEDSRKSYSNDEFDDLTVLYNKEYYVNVRRYSDCFRYNGHVMVVDSKEETFKLIEDNNIEITDESKKKPEEFWTLYPDGLIMFC